MDSPSHSNDFDSLLKLSSFINLLKSIDLPSTNPPPPNWSSILQPEPLKSHPKRHSFLPDDLSAPNSPPNLSKTLRDLAKSDHPKLQEKHEKLCLYLEELVECIPSIISTFQTLDCLKARLDNTVHKLSKTLTEANKATHEDLTFIEKKRIKTVRPRELDMNVINKEKGSLSKPSVQFMTPQYKPEARFDFSFKSSQQPQHQPQPKMSPAMKYMETTQVITEENFLKETEDSREFSFFEMSFEEMEDQKIEVFFTKRELLVSSDKFYVASVSLKYNNNGEVHGFLIKRAQQDMVLFVAVPVDEWLTLKPVLKTGGNKPVEELLFPLMDQNMLYKVESCDASGSHAYFTPIHKNSLL